jgi:uncharacterized protein involved in exopolysaccharide biosynthesis
VSVSTQSIAPDEIDLKRIGARLWSGRWLIAASMTVFTLGCLAAAFLLTPIYRATTVVVDASASRDGMGSLASALGQLGGLASIAGIDLSGAGAEREEALAVLRSREFTEGFLQENQLLPELFHRRWDAQAGRWKGAEEDWPTPAQAFRFFDKRVRTVSRDKLTGLITVEIEWRDRLKAAQWANALVERLNAEMRSRAIASTSAAVGYLEKELAATSAVETRGAIARLMEAQINQRMVANVTKEYAFRVVDRALPSDAKDEVRPNKPLLAALGPVLGLLFGALVVLIFRRDRPADR